LPILRGEFAALPCAVREYEIQELAFFGWRLTLEQDVRAGTRVPDAVALRTALRLAGRGQGCPPATSADARSCRSALASDRPAGRRTRLASGTRPGADRTDPERAGGPTRTTLGTLGAAGARKPG